MPDPLTRYEIVPAHILINRPDKSGEIVYNADMTLRDLLERIKVDGGGIDDEITFEGADGHYHYIVDVRLEKGEIILEGE